MKLVERSSLQHIEPLVHKCSYFHLKISLFVATNDMHSVLVYHFPLAAYKIVLSGHTTFSLDLLKGLFMVAYSQSLLASLSLSRHRASQMTLRIKYRLSTNTPGVFSCSTPLASFMTCLYLYYPSEFKAVVFQCLGSPLCLCC